MTIYSLVSSYPNELSPQAMAAGTMSSGSLKLTRSWSCRANLMTENAEQMESTPPNGFERDFPGRPEGLQRKFPLLTYGANTTSLSRNDSESSIGSASMDELRAHSTEASGEVEITSIHSFVAGLKDMAKLDREKQLVDGQVRTYFDFCPADILLSESAFIYQWSSYFSRALW